MDLKWQYDEVFEHKSLEIIELTTNAQELKPSRNLEIKNLLKWVPLPPFCYLNWSIWEQYIFQFHFLSNIFYNLTIYRITSLINHHCHQRTMVFFVECLGNELNTELKATIKIFKDRSMLWKILANFFYLTCKIHNKGLPPYFFCFLGLF